MNLKKPLIFLNEWEIVIIKLEENEKILSSRIQLCFWKRIDEKYEIKNRQLLKIN